MNSHIRRRLYFKAALSGEKLVCSDYSQNAAGAASAAAAWQAATTKRRLRCGSKQTNEALRAMSVNLLHVIIMT